jgi:pre-rRNA-processing protein TSR3
MSSIRLVVYHLNDDDPKKCSAKKLHRLGLVDLITKSRRIPRNMILLNPFAKKSLSPNDMIFCEKQGLLAVDCSWKHAEYIFESLGDKMRNRSLPFLIAVNPINYGKVLKLTTLEAFAGALFILNHQKQAEQILQIYKWGPHFLILNKEHLECYRKARNSTEIIQIMHQYLTESRG